jgi:hypothetical protein
MLFAPFGEGFRTRTLASVARPAAGLLAGEPGRIGLVAGAALLRVVHPLGRLAPAPRVPLGALGRRVRVPLGGLEALVGGADTGTLVVAQPGTAAGRIVSCRSVLTHHASPVSAHLRA